MNENSLNSLNSIITVTREVDKSCSYPVSMWALVNLSCVLMMSMMCNDRSDLCDIFECFFNILCYFYLVISGSFQYCIIRSKAM